MFFTAVLRVAEKRFTADAVIMGSTVQLHKEGEREKKEGEGAGQKSRRKEGGGGGGGDTDDVGNAVR